MKRGNFPFPDHKIRKISYGIHNLPSLLTLRNLKRIVTYLRLFGFKITFNEVNKKLFRDNYYLYGGINSIPIVKNSERLKYQSVQFEDTIISIVIPVKNAGDDFQNLLSMIKKQKGFKDIEIIVVDSGSTDNSLEIAREFSAKIIQILPDEFSHSFSRNVGAKHSSGDYLMFTVQDALPPNDLWLYELFNVMQDNDVVAVSCAESPRKDADLFYKAISWCHINFMEIEKQDRLMVRPDKENYLLLQKNGKLNNVACLISRDVFMKYRFRGEYAEDLDLGIRLIRDGYKLAITNSTKIIHSHNRPAYYYLKRGYVEHLYLSKLLPKFPVSTVDLDNLINEIGFNYNLLNSIVHKDLKEFNIPCKIKKLSRFIMHKLYNVSKIEYPDIIDTKNNEYIDNKFNAFLDGLSTHTHFNIKNNLIFEGILLTKIQSYTAMILEFMDNSYEHIDYNLLEEFKYCLYKTYAFICGTQLASSYMRYPDSTNLMYREIHHELTRQI